jgi:hypothetical protein
MTIANDWVKKGFASPPERRIAPRGGLRMFRAWGGSSTEWGSGYFSLEKPTSVLDAELRFNIADWGNEIHFVSTFLLKEGFPYYAGKVAHGSGDISKKGTQIYLESPFAIQVKRIGNFEVLPHDVFVSPRAGHDAFDGPKSAMPNRATASS